MMSLILLVAALGQTGPDISGDLTIFHAGSLSAPLAQISEEFMKEHPKVRVLREAAGSRECARKITDLGRACDVLASADYAVIDSMLIPKFAAWNIKFAGNELAIVYREKSRGASEINPGNWFDVLLRDNVAFGRSEPNADPCGYRTILCWKLAEQHYGQSGLADRFLNKDKEYVRPKETDLLALLETGAIDYIFLYRSVAEQHNLKWLPLPDEINLKNPALAGEYAKVDIELTGNKPGTSVRQKGEPMVYGVTIPSNAPNAPAALTFVQFLLKKDKGMAIMERNGQPSVVPAPTTSYGAIPEPLKRYAKP
jgi:molybdate/tungstate transport system substrate-binding protein